MPRMPVVAAGLIVVVSIAGLLWYASAPAQGQHGAPAPREEKHIVGDVISTTDTQVTVRADQTGEVIVWNAGWRKVPGTNKFERNPDHLALIGHLKKGDRVAVRGRYLEEQWVIDEIATPGAESDLAALKREVAGLRDEIARLRTDIAELKQLVQKLSQK